MPKLTSAMTMLDRNLPLEVPRMRTLDDRTSLDRAAQHMALASAYAEAARGVLAHQQDTANLPYFALVAHGFELAFKAVLIRRGWDEERLMLIGHDIARCRDAAQSMSDEPIDTDMEVVVESLSSPHSMQGLRYPQPIANALPDRELALGCLERLLRNVAPVIA